MSLRAVYGGAGVEPVCRNAHYDTQGYNFNIFQCVSFSWNIAATFPWRSRLQLEICNAEDEAQMKDGYFKQAIDSHTRQNFPAECVVGISVSPASRCWTSHGSECTPSYRMRQLFLSERWNTRVTRCSLAKGGSTFPDSWLFQCFGVCTHTHTRTHTHTHTHTHTQNKSKENWKTSYVKLAF